VVRCPRRTSFCRVLSDQYGGFSFCFLERPDIALLEPVVPHREWDQPRRPDWIARQDRIAVQRSDPVLIHLKLFQKLLAGLLGLVVVKYIRPQLLRINLDKLHSVGPIHMQGLGEFMDNFAVLCPLHSPIHLIQDPDIGSLQGLDFLRDPLDVDLADPLPAFLSLLSLLCHLGHKMILVGQKHLDVTEFEAALNVPQSNAERGPSAFTSSGRGFDPLR
jgi:hypothetical protein